MSHYQLDYQPSYQPSHGRTTHPNHHANLQVLKRIRQFLLPSEFRVSNDLLAQLQSGYDIADTPVDSLLNQNIKFAKPLQNLILAEQGLATDSNAENGKELLENPNFNHLYQQFCQYPTWFEPKLAEIGAVAYRRYPLMLIWLLRNVALMAGYSIPALSLPLIKTGALVSDALPRLMRTYAYILAVSEYRAVSRTHQPVLALGGEGWRQSLMVRQVHGLVRQKLWAENWDSAYWGVPINQTDMVATHLQFSLLIMRGLKLLGAKISKEESAGILHLWQLASWWMGVDLERLPSDETEAWGWLYSYLATQQLDFDIGKPLAKALHDLPSQIVGEDNWRGQMVELVNASVTRTLVGDDIGDGLELPKPAWRYSILASVPILFGMDTARNLHPTLTHRLERFRVKRQDDMNWWLKQHDKYYQ